MLSSFLCHVTKKTFRKIFTKSHTIHNQVISIYRTDMQFLHSSSLPIFFESSFETVIDLLLVFTWWSFIQVFTPQTLGFFSPPVKVFGSSSALAVLNIPMKGRLSKYISKIFKVSYMSTLRICTFGWSPWKFRTTLFRNQFSRNFLFFLSLVLRALMFFVL